MRFFRIFTSNFMLKEPVMVSAFSLLILFFYLFRKIVSSNLKYKNSPKRTRRLCVILEFQIWPYTYIENNISMLFMAHKYLEIGYKTCLLNSQCSGNGKVNLQKKQQKLMFSNFAPNVFWEK